MLVFAFAMRSKSATLPAFIWYVIALELIAEVFLVVLIFSFLNGYVDKTIQRRIDMPITPVKPTRAFIAAYMVPSTSIHKATHLVAQEITGRWVCSCPHFMFRDPADGCKHIRQVVAWCAENQPIPLQLPETVTRFFSVDM